MRKYVLNRFNLTVNKMFRVTSLEENSVTLSYDSNFNCAVSFIYTVNNLPMEKKVATSNSIKTEQNNSNTSFLPMVNNACSSNSNGMVFNNCIIRNTIALEEPQYRTLALHSGIALKRGEGVGLNQNDSITLNKSPPLTLRSEKFVNLEIIKN